MRAGIILGWFLLFVAPRPADAALTEGARLAAIYDTILAARFDEAARRLATACPPAPEPACGVLGVVSLWWQIVLDPESRALDARFEAAADAAIASAEAWTAEEPEHAEAWFYLAAARAPLVQWRVLRGERVAAAREGNRIRAALERALALDPTMHDAHFGIGLYHYYADVAPAAARVLRWLLFLPGGDREQGLREMLQAREQGELLSGEADYQLHWLYLWYEHDPARALELLRGLDERYPSNPVFLQRIAEVEAGYFQDHPASAAAWRALVDRARVGSAERPRLAEARARLGLADQLDLMFETDLAVEQLEQVVAMQPEAPYGAQAQAHLQLGAAYDRLGDRARATAAYEAALATLPDGDPEEIGELAREALDRTPDPMNAEAYRLSLEGWRLVERGAIGEAVPLLERAVHLAPEDPAARFRFARALVEAGRTEEARDHLERIVAARPAAPPVVRASAAVALAALLEASGDRSRAIDLYRRARDLRGGAIEARERARAALARLAP